MKQTLRYGWNHSSLIEKPSILAPGTISFYHKKFKLFNAYRSQLGIVSIKDISPQLIREYLIYLEEKGHNPGGVHAAYRALKTFLYWWEDEFEPEKWKNPFKKVKAPKNPQKPLEPADIQIIQGILSTCESNSFYDKRDKALILTLMDTGVRTSELVNMNLKDIDIISGEILIRRAKGGKFRNVFLGKKSRKALRAYLRKRQSLSPSLWVSKTGERVTYSTLRGILRRRSEKIGRESTNVAFFPQVLCLADVTKWCGYIFFTKTNGTFGFANLEDLSQANKGRYKNSSFTRRTCGQPYVIQSFIK